MDLPINYDKASSYIRRKAREQYVKDQNGYCFYCKSLLTDNPPSDITNKKIKWEYFPPNFLKFPIHLQHCHKTGMTEGAVHAYCNAVMWQYEGR